MKAFRECINDCCLIELPLMGKKFSWSTRGNSASRIDGAFMKADFRQAIKDFWFKAISSLDGQNKVVKAVNVLKHVLREWNKDSFVSKPSEVKRDIFNFYKDLLDGWVRPSCSKPSFKRLSLSSVDSMEVPFSYEEVKAAIWDCIGEVLGVHLGAVRCIFSYLGGDKDSKEAELLAVVKDIELFSSVFGHFSFCHNLREANFMADSLAKQGVNRMEEHMAWI
ncbi:hypothetical protein POTOM_044538 [Populus tomentosa]|uniref:Uncharacterized protein n=1 Tax=Populus tomentosa TaxID=118781 RepID=A0A8X8CEN0_POPTO|nr:hypothetical protein POTOM_044538 [Populus tomentosa]